jgi:aminocarboxymuconate-semialdehyde decarboxylase
LTAGEKRTVKNLVIDFENHYIPYEIVNKRRGQMEPGVDELYPDIEQHIRDMDIAGIDVAVLTNTSPCPLDEAIIFNNRCSEAAKKYPRRFIGFAMTEPLSEKEGLSELERAVKELGLRGVTINAQVDGLPLDSHRLWPFYQKASQLDIPVFVHVALAATGFDAMKASYEMNKTLIREFSVIDATTRVCLGGVLEEFPKIKFIMSHFGGGISSMKERLERYVEYWGAKFWKGKPLISEPYLERFNEHFAKIYFNTAGREIGMATMRCALTNISPKRLVFGTDYPPNFVRDPQGIKKYIQKIQEMDIGQDAIAAILGSNGIELLGLDRNSFG